MELGTRGVAVLGTLTIAAAAALLLMFTGRSGAAGSREQNAQVGEARRGSLTLSVPKVATTRIYGGLRAKGRPIVVIDAGHGGRDPGARSVSDQVSEKDLTLVLARELRDELVKRGRLRIALTREDDRYLTLEDRAAIASRLNAVMFVSLHMDSAPNPLARGATVYSLSDVASDAEAARFAAIENRAIGSTAEAGSVQAILSDLAARSDMSASADLAARVVRKAAGRVELRPNPHRFAAFHVLRRARTAAVLVEAGYVSNAEDEALLRSPGYRAKIVSALAQAIEADVATRSSH